MGWYEDNYPDRTLFPVIHVLNDTQTMRSASIAREAGCHGIFLIDHHRNWQSLIETYWTIRAAFPGWWIGLNFLDIGSFQALEVLPADAQGIWFDDAFLHDSSIERAIHLGRLLDTHPDEITSFSALAFKYQPQPVDLGLVCYLARLVSDIAVTSGTGTGQAADADKVAQLATLLDGHPLALASGVTADNVNSYPGVSAFMVATSITDPKTDILIRSAVTELMAAIHD